LCILFLSFFPFFLLLVFPGPVHPCSFEGPLLLFWFLWFLSRPSSSFGFFLAPSSAFFFDPREQDFRYPSPSSPEPKILLSPSGALIEFIYPPKCLSSSRGVCSSLWFFFRGGSQNRAGPRCLGLSRGFSFLELVFVHSGRSRSKDPRGGDAAPPSTWGPPEQPGSLPPRLLSWEPSTASPGEVFSGFLRGLVWTFGISVLLPSILPESPCSQPGADPRRSPRRIPLERTEPTGSQDRLSSSQVGLASAHRFFNIS
jgi:hypothetical protein